MHGILYIGNGNVAKKKQEVTTMRKRNMSKVFTKAHAMTREFRKEYKDIDYRTQFGLCLSYLLNSKEEAEMKITDFNLRTDGTSYILKEELKTNNLKGNPIIPKGTPVSFQPGLTGVTIHGDVVKEKMEWANTNSVSLGPFDIDGGIDVIRNLQVEKATPDNIKNKGVDFKIIVTGNTYPIKEKIKKDGGKWNPSNRAWILPADFKNWRKYETNSTSIQIEFIEERI